MLEIKHRRWLSLFVAVAFLLLAQVSWWTAVFIKDVQVIATLKTQVLKNEFGGQLPRTAAVATANEAFHRRLMFICESLSFVALAGVGFYLLFRALKVEERSRTTQKNFIEVLTHESKTPLTALKLRLESVRDKYDPDLTLTKDLGLALEEVRRLCSVFEKALNLNRVERQVYEFEVVYLADVVKEVVHRLEPLFRSKSIEVSMSLESEAAVRGDVFTLQASVQNLLENAALYNDQSDRQIHIELEIRSPHVVLWIEDNGPGIEPGEQTKIFERFFRGTSSRRVPGTGLGLYITRSIIEAHEGIVRLVRGDGRGTTFEILLPAASA
jgi:signal transduction histidine kinase